ncbi:MAG TPA: hypothetical protein VNL70_07890, partial [Tepidisphaeraceae bacterium]|nr:hypothetical protein [Tepidisphaeraceae bacterium]
MLIPSHSAQAQNLLTNGNLDRVHEEEIVPGFFLPKPDSWVNVGVRSISGPYEDEMSSEPWAGPAPTPVTSDGLANPAPFNNSPDWGVFFKPFTGNTNDGLATGHLMQAVLGTPGATYTLTGWAGAEPNALMRDAEFAIEFLDASSNLLGASVLSLMPTLFVDNGQPFDYKQYTVTGVAPAGTFFVRVRVSMLDAQANPAGGGQAFVVDDFVLVPEPASLGLVALAAVPMLARR